MGMFLMVVAGIFWTQTVESMNVTTGSKVPRWKEDEIRGICYSPVPDHVIPSQTVWLYDSDMFNTDFQALWGIDTRTPGVVSRDDLRYIKEAGFNLLHVYDWNPILRDHIPFLDYCEELGLGVFVPFSNWFLTSAWANHTAEIEKIVAGVTKDGEIHPAVFGWIVGNEYDETAALTPIDHVVDMLMDVVALDPDPENKRPFTIPSSTQAGYNDNIHPGLGQITEMREALLARAPDVYYNRFINAINPFMPFTPGMVDLILEPYAALYAGWGEAPLPLMFTETGLSQKDIDETGKYGPEGGDLGPWGMADFEAEIATGFLGLMRDESLPSVANASAANFIGYCFFEYTQEVWKGGGGVDMYYGLHQLGDNISPVLPTQVSKPFGCSTLPGQISKDSTYEVNALEPVPAWKAIAALQTNAELYRLYAANVSKVEHEDLVINCTMGEWKPKGDCEFYDYENSCKTYQVEVRSVARQANMHGASCPTALSRLVADCPAPVSNCALRAWDVTFPELRRYAPGVIAAFVAAGLIIFLIIKFASGRRGGRSSGALVEPRGNYGAV